MLNEQIYTGVQQHSSGFCHFLATILYSNEIVAGNQFGLHFVNKQRSFHEFKLRKGISLTLCRNKLITHFAPGSAETLGFLQNLIQTWVAFG
jgi:hypothetical protein